MSARVRACDSINIIFVFEFKVIEADSSHSIRLLAETVEEPTRMKRKMRTARKPHNNVFRQWVNSLAACTHTHTNYTRLQ